MSKKNAIDKRVNIGSKERPMWVPESATKPDAQEGNHWWEMVATGSVVLADEVFTALLKTLRGKKNGS